MPGTPALFLAFEEPDHVARLRMFEADHPRPVNGGPGVTVLWPATPHERWQAIIESGTVPGDPRVMIITERDLGAFVGRLEELFDPG